MIMGGKRMEKYYCHKNQLLSRVSERKIREMVAGPKTFTLAEKFSNLEKFSGISFLEYGQS